MIKNYYKSVKDPDFINISDFRVGSWINVNLATPEDMEKLQTITDLDKFDLQASLDKYESPRIAHKDNNIFLYIRHPFEEEQGLYTMTLTIIITDCYIITISPSKSFLVYDILKSQKNLTTTQKSKFLLQILLKITQDFMDKIKKVRTRVTEMENKSKNVTNEAILTLTQIEDTLNQYIATIIPMRNVMESLTSTHLIPFYEEDKDLMQELAYALKQSEDLCKINIKSIRFLREAYQMLFSNDINKTIKLLTAVTILVTIPELIAALYGMNITLPFEKSVHAFPIVFSIILTISITSFIIFYKKKWF